MEHKEMREIKDRFEIVPGMQAVYSNGNTQKVVTIEKVWKNGVLVIESGTKFNPPSRFELRNIDTRKEIWGLEEIQAATEENTYIYWHASLRGSSSWRSSSLWAMQPGDSQEAFDAKIQAEKDKRDAEKAEQQRRYEQKLQDRLEINKSNLKNIQKVETGNGTLWICNLQNEYGKTFQVVAAFRQNQDPTGWRPEKIEGSITTRELDSSSMSSWGSHGTIYGDDEIEMMLSKVW